MTGPTAGPLTLHIQQTSRAGLWAPSAYKPHRPSSWLPPLLPSCCPVFQSTHSSLAECPPGQSQHWNKAEDSPQGSGRPGVPALPEALINLCAVTWEMGTTPDTQAGLCADSKHQIIRCVWPKLHEERVCQAIGQGSAPSSASLCNWKPHEPLTRSALV